VDVQQEEVMGNQYSPTLDDNPKFQKYMEVGAITIPSTYAFGTFFADVRTSEKGKFRIIDNNITDDAFRGRTTQLNVGDTYRVVLFKQNVTNTSMRERVSFLQANGAQLVGSHALIELWRQYREVLPRKHRYISFDQQSLTGKERGVHVELNVSPGGYDLSLLRSIPQWTNEYLIVGFFLQKKI
jgi:hypothetical protein